MLKPETFTITELSQADFEHYAKALSPLKVPLEQTPLWGGFDDQIVNRSFLGSFKYEDSNGKLVAIGSATCYHQKGRDWIWFKHGPLFASVPNTEIVKKMCATLRQQWSTPELKPLFIRLTAPTFTSPLRLPFEHTMYDETVVVELKSEEEILAGMSQSGRQGIRRAQKAGVEVKEITQSAVEVFTKQCYPILKETGSRDGFGIHPLSLYTALLTSLPKNARLYTSSVAGKIEAWAITTEYNSQAMYYYGGSTAQARDNYAAYALHWEIMKQVKQRGNLTYDFMGIAGKHYQGLKNVTQFKIKFSKNIVQVPVTYDLPLQQLKYRVLSLALRTKRKLKK